MTLKEKITDQVQEMPLEVSPTQKDIDNYNLSINNLEKISDEFAIGFAEWMRQNTIYNGSEYYIYIDDSQQYKLNKLLEIYKKEKGL